jgi:hypothetical protein
LVAVFRDYDISAETLEANLTREMEVMRKLRHRNIIHLEDSFWVEDRLFICMELVEGRNLLRTVPPGGMKEDLAKDFFFQLCSAISYCHANNVYCLLYLLHCHFHSPQSGNSRRSQTGEHINSRERQTLEDNRLWIFTHCQTWRAPPSELSFTLWGLWCLNNLSGRF